MLEQIRHTISWAWPDLLGYLAALCTLAMYSMRTMIPLRTAGLMANALNVAFGYFAGVYSTLILHLVLFPLNATRLVQMMQLVGKVRAATRGDLSMDWLKPFMTRQRVRKGDVLFRRGDEAEGMFYTVSGTFRLTETGTDVAHGEIIGELGLLAPDKRRTRTLVCIEDGEVLTISYRAVEQLYYQNPKFGFYFLRLTTDRLFRDIARLEDEVARLKGGQA
jgi:CRP/FNR family transcriptional regulator, cyclic AMP receptor protein